MPPTPPPEQAPGRLAWNYALDLTRLDALTLLDEVYSLHRPWCRGHSVSVHVGHVRPVALDPRIPDGLLEARNNGVHIAISGTPGAVADWWRVLKPRKPARHLQVVCS